MRLGLRQIAVEMKEKNIVANFKMTNKTQWTRERLGKYEETFEDGKSLRVVISANLSANERENSEMKARNSKIDISKKIFQAK